MNIKLSLLLINLLWILSLNAEPLVTISQGTLNGTLKEARYGRKYSAFLGIPYAKPPTGERRFKNPEPADAWTEVRPAHAFGNVCPQTDSGKVFGNDDCLFVNVYTPFLKFEEPLPSDNLLPVMVFIHGGSFFIGSGNMYGAGYLLEKNIILVTLNYRLGILGFLTTDDAVAPGNFGLKDQVEALKWVQKNIRSFGGDPEKVTLVGESAGGVAVNLHAISNISNGLFQKYIMQSGTAVGPDAYQDKESFHLHVKNLARKFNCPLNSSQLIIDCLQKVHSNDLVKMSNGAKTVIRYGHFIWLPTIESDTPDAFLTDSPLNIINNNQTKDIPFMSGTCTDEALPFTTAAYSKIYYYMFYRFYYSTKLINYLAKYYKQDEKKFFTEINNFYFNNTFHSSSRNKFLNMMAKFYGDAAFVYPQIRMMEKVTSQKRNQNYFYNFGYRGALSLTEVDGDKTNYGVSHGDDLIYLFPVNYGQLKTSNGNFTSADEKVSRIMVDFWTSFATNGKPTSSELENPNLWEPYSLENTSHIQIGNIINNTDPTVSVSNTFYTERINFWRENAPI